MRYIVHLKYPLMYWDKDHLVTFKKLDFPKEPHIITQDGERYVELPRYKYRIDINTYNSYLRRIKNINYILVDRINSNNLKDILGKIENILCTII